MCSTIVGAYNGQVSPSLGVHEQETNLYMIMGMVVLVLTVWTMGVTMAVSVVMDMVVIVMTVSMVVGVPMSMAMRMSVVCMTAHCYHAEQIDH